MEEIEDWNEYGELKENIEADGPVAATAAASTTATPSDTPSKPDPIPTPQETTKAPSTVEADTSSSPSVAPMEEKSKDASPTASGLSGGPASSLTMAMRQAGAEAAKKAGEAKAKAVHKTKMEDKTSTLVPPVSKTLDHSAGVPPPSGTVEPASEGTIPTDPGPAVDHPEGPVPEHKAQVSDSAALSSQASIEVPSKDAPTGLSATTSQTSLSADTSPSAVTQHRGSSVSLASAEEIKEVEQRSAIAEEPEPVEENPSHEEVKPAPKDDGHVKFASDIPREAPEPENVNVDKSNTVVEPPVKTESTDPPAGTKTTEPEDKTLGQITSSEKEPGAPEKFESTVAQDPVPKTQQQPAAAEEDAGASVKD